MTKRKKKTVEISIGVVCIPRDDKKAAAIMQTMAIAAAPLLGKRTGAEMLEQMDEWLQDHKLAAGEPTNQTAGYIDAIKKSRRR